MQGTLEDMHAAFPSSAFVKTHNLHTFMNTVEGLFRIGDYQVGPHPSCPLEEQAAGPLRRISNIWICARMFSSD